MAEVIISLDQGTTSSRALAFAASGRVCGASQQEFQQHFPQDGWVEHDAEVIWQTTQSTCRAVLATIKEQGDAVIGLAIANQRETLVVWDRKTGTPIYNAIVWQDRRTADMCDALRPAHEDMFRAKTGLLLDPYFSMSKLSWILDNVPNARARAEAGALMFGTIECWLLFNLTSGVSHITDITNAARTGLFNIHTHEWDDDLLRLFNIPPSLLPQVADNIADFGTSTEQAIGMCIPICAMAGDQQAAALGQACFAPAMVKSTYGTGCFLLAHTGSQAVLSQNRLLTTIAYRFGGETAYALEGSIFMAGAIIHWLRDGLQLIDSSDETQSLAAAANAKSDVICIPAFTGLGAPHWQPHARAALVNMNHSTSKADIVRAALEAISHQTDDLLVALMRDMKSQGLSLEDLHLRVDGGAAENDWLCQNLADICACPIDRPRITETTALGVAMLAFLHLGIFKSVADITATYTACAQFSPEKSEAWRQHKRKVWHKALDEIIAGSGV